MNDTSISVDVLTRQSRSSLRLHITDDGLVEVRAPHFMPEFFINRFVQSKREWIIRAKKRVLALPKSTKQAYAEGSLFCIAGVRYTLHHTDGNSIVIAGSRIFFPKKFVKHPKQHMEGFLRKFAKKYLSERALKYASAMGVRYKRISIRDTRSRWGSCSSWGTISFAYRLMLADAPIIDYVVIHELSHITHHNHKQVFWNRVGEYYPDYKAARTWLRKNGHTLHI